MEPDYGHSTLMRPYEGKGGASMERRESYISKSRIEGCENR